MSGEDRIAPTKMGRPPKLVESEELLKQIESLARIQCTKKEAAAVLRVHQDTLADFLQAHEKARIAWEDGIETGKASLRRLQYKSAESGNTTMQIWLGKQMLDQTDKTDARNTHEVGDRMAHLLAKLTGDVIPGHAIEVDTPVMPDHAKE